MLVMMLHLVGLLGDNMVLAIGPQKIQACTQFPSQEQYTGLTPGSCVKGDPIPRQEASKAILEWQPG